VQAQLTLCLAQRSAERIRYGEDGMSNLPLPGIIHARRIINRLVLTSAMSDVPEIGPRALAAPIKRADSRYLHQIEENILSTETRAIADREMERMLLEVRDAIAVLHASCTYMAMHGHCGVVHLRGLSGG
jgi:hypothetical protein